MTELTSLTHEHLEDAANLVSNRYQRLLGLEPHLPANYAEVDNLLPHLQRILEASGSGVAAIRSNQLVGFLAGWHMPSFRGKRSIYSPEWANAAVLEDSRVIYEHMYGRIAADWAADEYFAHYISLFSNDIEALKAWHWMGFGMVAIDAVRGLDPIQGSDADILIRRAEPQDIELVVEMHEALWEYHRAAPIFLISEKKDRSYYENWLKDPDRVVWLAYRRDEPVAFIRTGPADKDVCTIIFDEGTTSAYAAFTGEAVRREGIASTLLNHALRSAKESGYRRCAVSFEPMNTVATRCWLRYFNPVCLSVVRFVDDPAAKDR